MAKIDETFYDLRNHPEHCVAISRIVASFSMLEVALCNIFSWCIHCAPPHAAAAFYSLSTANARIQMLRGLLPYLHTDQERSEVEGVIEIAAKAATLRNTYAHGLWSVGEPDPYLHTSLNTRYPEGLRKPVTIKELKDHAELCAQTARDASEALVRLSAGRPLFVSGDAVKPSYAKIWPQQPRRRSR